MSINLGEVTVKVSLDAESVKAIAAEVVKLQNLAASLGQKIADEMHRITVTLDGKQMARIVTAQQ